MKKVAYLDSDYVHWMIQMCSKVLTLAISTTPFAQVLCFGFCIWETIFCILGRQVLYAHVGREGKMENNILFFLWQEIGHLYMSLISNNCPLTVITIRLSRPVMLKPRPIRLQLKQQSFYQSMRRQNKVSHSSNLRISINLFSIIIFQLV